MYLHYGNKLASLRGKLLMKQKEVANFLKISIDKYARMERSEKRPADDTLEKLAALYKMTILQIDDYDPSNLITNNIYKKTKQVNQVGSTIASSIDNAIEKVLNEQDLQNGEEVTLAITIKIIKPTG